MMERGEAVMGVAFPWGETTQARPEYPFRAAAINPLGRR